MGKGKIILITEIPRETGFLYYCATNEKTGCLTIGKAPMARGGKKKKKAKK